jgi:hypothetical protein
MVSNASAKISTVHDTIYFGCMSSFALALFKVSSSNETNHSICVSRSLSETFSVGFEVLK